MFLVIISYNAAETDKDLIGILLLQLNNLRARLTPEEAQEQGFLTVVHSLETLQKMNSIEPHIVAKQNDEVIAYLLAMTSASKYNLPILLPMFEAFEKISYEGKPVSSYNYVVVGQVCVAREFRGQGILDKCYEAYRNRLQPRYDFAITEIATLNARSISAHKRIGFQEIHRYNAPNSEQWSIVVWKW